MAVRTVDDVLALVPIAGIWTTTAWLLPDRGRIDVSRGSNNVETHFRGILGSGDGMSNDIHPSSHQ